MNSRQRGAAWILAALLAGRLVDHFDLPFEHRFDGSTRPEAAGDTTSSGGGAPAAGADSTPSAPKPHPATAAAAAALATPVAINHATVIDLQRLPGVGPVLAGRIVAHRDAHGPFRGLEDLNAVKGLGPKTCARLAPLVRFD